MPSTISENVILITQKKKTQSLGNIAMIVGKHTSKDNEEHLPILHCNYIKDTMTTREI